MLGLLFPLLIVGFILYKKGVLKPIHFQKVFRFIEKTILNIYNHPQKEYKKSKVTPIQNKKKIEEQKAEKEKYILQQIEISSQQKVKKAEAKKQAKILEGEGIAKYNKSIQQEIISNVLEYKRLETAKNAIEKWNGAYSQTYFGEGGTNSPIPLINLQK